MPTGTFVLFDIVRFPDTRRPIRTEPRRPRGSRDEEADPVFTELRFTRQDTVAGFEVARVTHRRGVHVEGFWHGTPITQFVEQKVFNAFFRLDDRALIAHTKKEIALAAADALCDEFSEVLELRNVELDFGQIIPIAINVIGSWFKGMRYTNIRSEAAFGSQINRDPEFLRMSRLGNHSNLVVVMNFGGEQIEVNLSRDGSAFFMGDYPVDVCLRFVIDLRRYRVTP
jgi:hypothetical protein